jgi:hypothetical protein
MARDGSALVVKRAKRTLPSRPQRKAHLRKPADLRREAEELLREMAFVFRATRAVRKAMDPTPGPGA